MTSKKPTCPDHGDAFIHEKICTSAQNPDRYRWICTECEEIRRASDYSVKTPFLGWVDGKRGSMVPDAPSFKESHKRKLDEAYPPSNEQLDRIEQNVALILQMVGQMAS